MPVPLRYLLVAALLTALAVVAGVLVRGDPPHETAPRKQTAPFTTTPLAKYDTSGAVVTRGSFCDAFDSRQVSAALGGAPTDSSSWRNGETIDLGNGATDVGHEFGCRFTAADGTVAEAWVFAPPVTADQAHQMVKNAAKAPGCQSPPTAPTFGSPTLALTCTTKDGAVHASYRGLFGDAWLVCEVDSPSGAEAEVVDTTGRWCVGVLRAARPR